MKSYPGTHHRRSIRLRNFDYSQAGAYFVTTCTQGHTCLFGEVTDGKMQLNEPGQIVQMVWDGLTVDFPGLALDMFVIMPNHIHGIMVIDVRAGWEPAPMQSGLPGIVHALKTHSSRRINAWRRTPGTQVWQRGYYEHVVRNEADLNRLREYIHNNPMRWELDRLHPSQGSSNLSYKGRMIHRRGNS